MKSMEKKKENPMANMRFSDENPSSSAAAATGFGGGSIFDMASAGACEGSGGDKWGSLGFMDLLGIHQDFVAPYFFDSFHQPPPPILSPPTSSSELEPHREILHREQLQLDNKQLQQQELQGLPSPASTIPESSEILSNPPATPNSSSISSSSNEAANDDQTKAGDDEEQDDQDQDKTKKQ